MGRPGDDSRRRTRYGRTWVMWGRASVAVACAVSLVLASASLAAAPRAVSVGYDSAAALRGLHVLSRITPLHVAEVSSADLGKLRGRAGVRWIRSTVPRRHLGTW